MPRSLHARMLLLSAAATLVALALAGLAIAALLGRFVTEGLDRRLDAEVTLLASVIDADGRIDRPRLDQRLGAFERGPGWRWRIAGPDGALGSADFPSLDEGPLGEHHHPGPPAPPDRPDDALRPLDGATERGVAVHARQLTIATRRGPVTVTAVAPREVVQRPIRGAVAPLLIALAALAGLLTVAVLVQLRIGLRPVRRLRDDVAAIRAGRRSRVGEDQPTELRPLAAELNALASDGEAALAAARGSAANLAHALKTPVATLAIDVRDTPQLAAQVQRIEATIRHHLARARAQAVNRRAATPLAPALDGVATAVRRLHRERAVAIDIAVPTEPSVALDPHDLDELLGNLLDNAARHAAGRVVVTARREGRSVAVDIADDGPGVPTADRALAVRPGTRLDERGDGHGFGLAIAGELVSLYGGTMTLDEAEGGGLLVRLRLPGASDL